MIKKKDNGIEISQNFATTLVVLGQTAVDIGTQAGPEDETPGLVTWLEGGEILGKRIRDFAAGALGK